jgi:hypothetical protein
MAATDAKDKTNRALNFPPNAHVVRSGPRCVKF